MTKVSVENYSLGVKHIGSPKGFMGAMTKIINSEMDDYFGIDTGSCLNKCSIGSYFGLGCYSYIANTEIGRYCTIASRVSIGAFNHPTSWLSVHEFQYRDLSIGYGETVVEGENILGADGVLTSIGSDVWIGDNATIRRGVSIGTGAIVGMSTVVLNDVPPYAVIVGNPGRVVKYRFSPDLIKKLLSSKWWSLDLPALKGLDFRDIEGCLDKLSAKNHIDFSAE